MPYRYIFYIGFLGICDAINIKGVKWVFRYFRNIKGTPSIKKNNVLKRLGLKSSSITYISGPNGVFKKKTLWSNFHLFNDLLILLKTNSCS